MTNDALIATDRALWRVVVVDDSPDDRAEIRRMLFQGSERRYKFVEAETGSGAVREILGAADGPPDCLVIDYNLPDMDASEVIMALMGPDRLPVCPIVVITGEVGSEMGRAVLRAGAQDYIGKDWLTPPGMTRAIENAVERFSLARQLRASDAAARESAGLLRLAAEATDTGLWTWDVAMDVVAWSAECYRIHRVTTHEFDGTGAAFFRLVHPDDRARVEATVLAAIEDRTLYECEFRIIRPGGEVRWVANRGRSVRDESSRTVRMLGTITDITGRKRVEARARENEERLRVALAASSAVGFTWDIPEDRVVRFHSLEPAVPANPDAPGRVSDVRAVVHPDDRGRFDRALQSCLANGSEYRSEFRIVRPDGSVRWLQEVGILARDASGRPLRLTGVSRDVTDQKQVEAALQEGEERLRLALEAAHAGMWELVPATGEFVASGRAMALHGISPGTPMTHERALAAVHPDDRAAVEVALRKALEEGVPFRVEIRAPQPDGSVRWLSSSAELRDVLAPPRLIGLVQDITPRKQTEANLAFLAGLGEAFAPAVTAEEITRAAAEKIARHFEVSRVNFSDVNPAGDEITVFYSRHDPGLRDDRMTHRLSEYLDDAIVAELRAGRTVAIGDVRTDPRTSAHAANFARWDVGSMMLAPGTSDGRWRFLIVLHRGRAGPWRDDAIGLFGEVATRVHLRLERARAEESLRAAHDTFRHLVDNSPFGVYVVDADFRLIQVSAGARRVFENVHPLIGRDFAEVLRILWPEPFAGEAVRRFRHTLGTGEPYHAPGTVERRHDIGEVESYDWKIERIVLPDGRFGVVCHFYDLSERQRWEQALLTKERELRSLAENSPDILVRFDRELRHIFVNASVERVTGRPGADFLGKTNRELGMPAELCDPWDEAIRSVFEDGRPRIIEFTFPTRQGERHYASRLVPEFSQEGVVESVLGIAHDITDHKRYEEVMREQDRRKNEFLATLAHELRNPLAPIRNGLELLRAVPGGAMAAEAREMMGRQVAHMVRLVDDLLDVSRIGQGKIQLRRERVEVRAVLVQAVEASRPLIERAGHRLDVAPPPEPVWLDGDPTRLAQVVSNLLNNAAKYTPSGGRIDLSAAVEAGEVAIRVRDNGVGISPDMLPRVFDLFTQVDQTLDQAQGGLGIGLSLVKKLAEMHGGSVTAESEGEWRGSTFTVQLPEAPPPADPCVSAPHERAATVPTARPSLRVLVVDDSKDGALSLALLVKQLGHVTRVAHDGSAALAAAREFRPQVVFLDIGLPDTDGYEVCRLLRAEPDLIDATIVALTGWGAEEDRIRARDAGFALHLVKPVAPDRIAAVLRGSGVDRPESSVSCPGLPLRDAPAKPHPIDRPGRIPEAPAGGG